MKKPQFDLECNFSDLPPKELEAACKYEYMRESQALRTAVRDKVRDKVNEDFQHPHLPRIAPYLDRLSRLCTPDCPRQYGFWQSEYRIYCSHCNNTVDLPCENWVKKLFGAVQRKAARSAERALKRKKERGNALSSFAPGERHRLVLALVKAGFPALWNELSGGARDEFMQRIDEWDQERKKSDPPVVIKAGVLERAYHPQVLTPFLRLALCQRASHWPPKSPSDSFFAGQSKGKYFYGFIRIDEGYTATEVNDAFRAWLKDHWRKTKSGGGPNWQARLNDLVVMRLWDRFPKKQAAIKRLEHIAKFTTAGFKGCKEWCNERWKQKKWKLGFVDQRISQAANEEMSRARADALKYFQSLFPGEKPLSSLSY
jgi:hypothetical protein